MGDIDTPVVNFTNILSKCFLSKVLFFAKAFRQSQNMTRKAYVKKSRT